MQETHQNENSGKVGTLAAVLRLGHEAFNKGNFEAAAAYVVNNSRLLTDYDRSCLVSSTDGAAKVFAVSGQGDFKPGSEYCRNMISLAEPFLNITSPEEVSPETLDSRGARQPAKEAYEYFKSSNPCQIMIFPLMRPSVNGKKDERFLWIVEFFAPPPKNAMPVLALLSRHYAEALFYYSETLQSGLKTFLKNRGWTSFRIAAGSVLLFVVLLFAIRISNMANADFQLVPFEESIEYAPFSGIIGGCLRENGDIVRKGDPVISYRTEDFAFSLALAKKNFEEASAELDLTRQKAFTDNSELGKIRLLYLRLEKEKIEMEKYTWFLDRSKITAGMDGALFMDEKRKMAGKHVEAGEKLFEIISTRKLIAEIRLDETNASVLGDNPSAVLFLHTMPETPLRGKILSVSPKPVQMEDTGHFVYLMRMEISGSNPSLICGMRGIAKIRGRKVSLAYFIFRSVILWWRKI